MLIYFVIHKFRKKMLNEFGRKTMWQRREEKSVEIKKEKSFEIVER